MTSDEKICRAEKNSARHSFWLGLVIIALAFTAGAVLTWRRWPDLIVDFGLQLYLPWRIADGAVLYRDLFYLAGGPLSQYFHAALFKLFSATFLTIIISNLVITAAMVLAIYHGFRRVTDTVTGIAIALAVVTIFAFGQYTGIGNNNYLAPYSHEMLHGLTLAIFTVALLASWVITRKTIAIVLAGFCAGLVLLTKPDIFLALALTTVLAFALVLRRAATRALVMKTLVGFMLAAIIPVVGFFLIFLNAGSWRESLQLVFFGWRPIFVGSVVNDPYYKWSLGLDTPFDHLRQTSIHFLVCAAVIIACALVFRAAKSLSHSVRWLVIALTATVLLLVATRFNWISAGACLPLLCCFTIGLLLRKIKTPGDHRAVIFPLLWSLFALLMLAKQGVFPRIWHTGFALAMPAFVTAVYLFVWLLPEFLESRFQIPPRPMRLMALVVLVVACVSLVRTSAQFYSARNLAVGHGPDLIRARGPTGNSVEARNMNLALDWIEKNIPPNATLAAIPQGAMLNFLSQRINPTPCLDWNPTMLAVFGATNMTAALQKNPPDYIALVEWSSSEFGTGYFGTGSYGSDVMTWIQGNYQPAALFGSEPLRNGLFGIKILKHQSSVPGTNSVEKPTGSP